MASVIRYLGQGAFWLAFAAVLGYFSTAPAYRHLPPGEALLKLSFTHGGERKVACRKRTREELMKLAPNMRKQEDCPRRRVDLALEIDVDGKRLYAALLAPTGLSGDGPSHVYRVFPLPAGHHVFDVRMRDTRRQEGFDHVQRIAVTLAAGQNAAIDFRARAEGFVLR